MSSLQPDTSGMATADVVDAYNGAPDRYEWTLSGKQEMLVPYNSYAVHQKVFLTKQFYKRKRLILSCCVMSCIECGLLKPTCV